MRGGGDSQPSNATKGTAQVAKPPLGTRPLCATGIRLMKVDSARKRNEWQSFRSSRNGGSLFSLQRLMVKGFVTVNVASDIDSANSGTRSVCKS